jgi:hypothetical protein
VMTTEDRFAVVEIFGHRRHAGRVREVSFAGVTMLEIEQPKEDGTTELHRYGGSAIFGMRFVTEEEAKKAAEAMWPRSWTRPQLPAPGLEIDADFDEDEPALGDEPLVEDDPDAHEGGDAP